MHPPCTMKAIRLVLIGVLALAGVACEPTERDMTPIPDAGGESGAPLFDEAVDPDETMGEIDDGDGADDDGVDGADDGDDDADDGTDDADDDDG